MLRNLHMGVGLIMDPCIVIRGCWVGMVLPAFCGSGWHSLVTQMRAVLSRSNSAWWDQLQVSVSSIFSMRWHNFLFTSSKDWPLAAKAVSLIKPSLRRYLQLSANSISGAF